MENTLQKKIKRDQVQARKSQDKRLALILGTLFAEVQRTGKDDGNRETTDKEAQLVIAKFLKDLRTTFKIYTGMEIHEFKYVAGKEEVDSKMTKAIELYSESKVYEEYLPAPLTIENQEVIIQDQISKGITSLGQIMGFFSNNYKGMYNGKELKVMVQKSIAALSIQK